MFKRRAYNALLDWRASEGHGALLVTGARQIGKTFLVKEFAEREYAAHVTVDFIEDSAARARYAAARTADQVVDLLSLELGSPLIPGNTLVFFDEVQAAPEIVTFSKYLVQDGRFDVVMSGSMLGTELASIRSMPVGYLQVLDMAPMTFEEFCWAQGVPDSILAGLRTCFEAREPVAPGIHEKMTELFRRYLVMGGMPAVVTEGVGAMRDLGAVREVQTDLVRLYREDIAKYAGSRSLQVKGIFDALPSELNKMNKRFQMRSAGKAGKYERYANDFAWLVAACAALKTDNVTDPRPMLERTAEKNKFKLYSSDVGMLMAQYPAQTSMAALVGEKSVNFGAVYENYVAQELAAAGDDLFYYNNNRRGEVDFLLELTSGGILPIEVKSGKDYKLHTALNNLLGTEEYGIREAVVLSEANVSVEDRDGKKVIYLPLYMAGMVASLGASRASAVGLLGSVTFEPIEWPEA